MNYFVLWFKLDYRHQYTIWCTGKQGYPDQLYHYDGLIPVFDRLDALKKYADQRHIVLDEETPVLHHLDHVKVWLKTRHQKTPNDVLLTAWNLFGDIAAIDHAEHLKFELLTQKYLAQYRKLFAAQNMLCNTARPKYHPTWTKEEQKLIADVLGYGFNLLRKHFRHQTI